MPLLPKLSRKNQRSSRARPSTSGSDGSCGKLRWILDPVDVRYLYKTVCRHELWRGSVGALHAEVYIGLSGYGFDNVTSSYQVGGCAATFYDTAGGTGTYPGSTGAGASASSMVSGWDNRISSIRIS